MPPLRDPDRLAFHHRIRRIDDYAFISIQAGYHFDLVAEIMAQGDRLQRHLLTLANGRYPQTLGAEEQHIDRQD